jgi:hypothetical protein
VGNTTTNLVHNTTAGRPGSKAVLYCLADLACDRCGRAWPGVEFIARRTEMGKTGVRKALDDLKAAGLITVHAFPSGGRGRATEYIVLPQLPKLSTAPCVECGERSKTHRTGGGFIGQGDAIPTGFDSKTHRTGGGHPLENQYPLSSAAPRNVESDLRPDGEPTLSPPPTSPEYQAAKDALRGMGLFDPAPEDENRPERGKAQG